MNIWLPNGINQRLSNYRNYSAICWAEFVFLWAHNQYLSNYLAKRFLNFSSLEPFRTGKWLKLNKQYANRKYSRTAMIDFIRSAKKPFAKGLEAIQHNNQTKENISENKLFWLLNYTQRLPKLLHGKSINSVDTKCKIAAKRDSVQHHKLLDVSSVSNKRFTGRLAPSSYIFYNIDKKLAGQFFTARSV